MNQFLNKEIRRPHCAAGYHTRHPPEGTAEEQSVRYIRLLFFFLSFF